MVRIDKLVGNNKATKRPRETRLRSVVNYDHRFHERFKENRKLVIMYLYRLGLEPEEMNNVHSSDVWTEHGYTPDGEFVVLTVYKENQSKLHKVRFLHGSQVRPTDDTTHKDPSKRASV